MSSLSFGAAPRGRHRGSRRQGIVPSRVQAAAFKAAEGLHISRRVTLEHGGRLEVTSNPGEGARFKLWLPLSRESLSIHG